MGNESSSNQTVSDVYPKNTQPVPLTPRLSITKSITLRKLPNLQFPSNSSCLTSRTSLTLQFPPQTTTPTRSKSLHKRRKSSLLIVSNNITGIYISSRICKIAAKFWQHSIDQLAASQRLEIACSIFFSMLSYNSDLKRIMRSSSRSCSIEQISIKYVDMLGWLMRHLATDNIDLYSLLTRLGVMHQKFGVNIKHFDPMLQAMHETFSYYFGAAYTIEIKYAMDEIFSLAAQIMTGQELKCNAHLNSITKQFQKCNIPFLQSLEVCLASAIGREYLYLYFAQTWCDEIAIFLKEVFRFKLLMSDKERFMVARDIIKTSIQATATFCLNLSYGNRMNTINKMDELNGKFLSKQKFEVKTDFFANVERETHQLIMENHWLKFVKGIKVLQSKSFSVE